jgi:chaperonin GroEL
LFNPEVHLALGQGVESMTALLASTLGPLGRTILLESLRSKNDPPEVLADAATIAHRMVKLPNRPANVGAMLVREQAMQMRDQVGDGSATAAVLTRAMVRNGMRMVAAGANPQIVQRGIEAATRAAVAELKAFAQPLASAEMVAAIARATTGEALPPSAPSANGAAPPRQSLSDLIAEIFSIVGVDGTIVVQEHVSAIMEREYVEGIHWDSGGLAAPSFVTDAARQETVLIGPMIAVANLEVNSSAQVVPLLERALKEKFESLVIIARRIEGEALAILQLNKDKLAVMPVKGPGLTVGQPKILQDLAILTGATLVDQEAGGQLAELRREDFGQARRVIATRRGLTIVGARGRQRAIRQRILELQAELDRQGPREQADTLRKRLANLSGGVATLKIGAATEAERKLKREAAEDAIRAVRAALQEGVVAGGGAAFMACIPALALLESATGNQDEALGVRVVAEALNAPLKQIAANAGYTGSTVAARVSGHYNGLDPDATLSSPHSRHALPGDGFGFDARSGQVVSMWETGIVDSVKVLRTALEMAASTAAMVLTTEAVVFKKRERM